MSLFLLGLEGVVLFFQYIVYAVGRLEIGEKKYLFILLQITNIKGCLRLFNRHSCHHRMSDNHNLGQSRTLLEYSRYHHLYCHRRLGLHLDH